MQLTRDLFAIAKILFTFIVAIPCASDPCQNGGTCANNADFTNYTCTCPPAFTGANCETGNVQFVHFTQHAQHYHTLAVH